ncbi:hypothetical protein Tco_0441218 [Tanacetum coccineum]
MIRKYFSEGMPLDIIKNLYVPFGIPFDPKLLYKDGACTSIVKTKVTLYGISALIPQYCVLSGTEYEAISKPIYGVLVHPNTYGTTPKVERHAWIRLNAQDYDASDIQDFESRLARIYDSYAWRALFGIRKPLIREIILEFFNTLREPLKRLCHRMIAFTIARRGQAPEKVTTTDLFFLRSMDEGTVVNVPYLLMRFLFRFALGRKQGAQISEGHFIIRVGVHFGVITDESIQTLTMEVRGLTTINIHELVRLRIYKRLGDVVTWLVLGPQRQQAMGGASQIGLEVPHEHMLVG